MIWLSGPSSSGKTTVTRSLEEKGWLRIEADNERPETEVRYLETSFLDKINYIKSHLSSNATSAEITGAIWGGIKPIKTPSDPSEHEKIRLELLEALRAGIEPVNHTLLIHMLDKAIEAALLGKNVILDHIHMINETEFFSHKVTKDVQSSNLWCYRNFKIEQQLKFVPLDTLMRNVIRRNHDPEDYRPIPMVLEQYSKRFITTSGSINEHLGVLKVESLKKWIERSVKLDFFDINPNHGFKYSEAENVDIDVAIEERMDKFIIAMNDPENALDPSGVKVDENAIQLIREKKAEFPNLQKKIDLTIKNVMDNMGIPETATKVFLTYASTSNIKPTIV